MINFNNSARQILQSAATGYELNPAAGYFSIVTPAGQVVSLKSLGVKVLSYIGASMPPVENITTPLGIQGGSTLQRQVTRPRVFTLACSVMGENLLRVQRQKQSLINLIRPSNSLQNAQALKLRFQLFDDCGIAQGNILEVPVIYQGELTGQTDNLNEERFALQFLELAPPGITELATITQLLTNYEVVGTWALRYRASTGLWTTLETAAIGQGSLFYDSTGDLFYGKNGAAAAIKNRSGTINQAVSLGVPANTTVAGIVKDAPGNIYGTGNFTTPQNYIMKYNIATGLWVAMGTGLSGPGAALIVDYIGNVYVTGNFANASAVANTLNIARWDKAAAAFQAMGVGGLAGGVGKCLARDKAGNIYVGGTFTSAGGVAGTSWIAKWNVTTLAWESVGGGIAPAGASGVTDMVFLPDGRLVVCGSFTNKVQIFNGTAWQTMPGLPAITNVVSMDVDNTGTVFIIGNGLASNQTYYQWNGSKWIWVTDIITSIAGTQGVLFRQSDNEIAFSNSTPDAMENAFVTVVNNAGTADVFPLIKITGSGFVNSIVNWTTGKFIYFIDYTLQAGEIALLQAGGPDGVSFTSNIYGNILNKIQAGSDINQFSLVPGNNNIAFHMQAPFTAGASKCELLYKNTHWSFEAGV